MQPKKTKIALLLGAACLVGASGAAHAATADFTITVNTIPDVVLTQVRALAYGTRMFVTAGGTCLMNAATPGDAATALMQYDDATLAAANYGALSGTGCVNGAAGSGTPGLYRIAGLAGSSVTVTITGVTGADFAFAPNSGCIVNYDGTVAADTCDAFVPGVPIARRLALANAAESPVTGGGVGVTTAGQLMFTVGGTVTVGGVDLNPNQAYTENFTVVAVY